MMTLRLPRPSATVTSSTSLRRRRSSRPSRRSLMNRSEPCRPRQAPAILMPRQRAGWQRTSSPWQSALPRRGSTALPRPLASAVVAARQRTTPATAMISTTTLMPTGQTRRTATRRRPAPRQAAFQNPLPVHLGEACGEGRHGQRHYQEPWRRGCQQS